MTRRLVFVPLFGDTTSDHDNAWLKAPHVKAWGFKSDKPGNHGGEFIPIHTDPPCTAITLFEATTLFKREGEAAIELTGDEPDIPTEVAVALATMALLPEKELPDGN